MAQVLNDPALARGRRGAQLLAAATWEIEAGLAASELVDCQVLLAWPLHVGMQKDLWLKGTLLVDQLSHLHLLRGGELLQSNNSAHPEKFQNIHARPSCRYQPVEADAIWIRTLMW